jgi:hypothetical protein
VYDPETGYKPKPNLRSIEGESANTNSPTSGITSSAAGSARLSTNEELTRSENGSAKDSTTNDNDVGSTGFWKAENAQGSSLRGGVKNIAGRILSNKKAATGGGIGIIILIVGYIGFGFITTYTLDTISHDDTNYQSGLERDAEKKVNRKLFSKILCWQNPRYCKDDPDPEDSQSEPAAEPGEELTDEAESFKLNNPTVETDLNKVGIGVSEDPTTGAVTLTGSDGQPITAGDILDDTNGVADTIEDGLPDLAVGELEDYRPLMYDEAGASFDIMTDTANDNVQNDVDTAVDDGAQGQAAAQDAATEESENKPDSKAPPDEVTQYQNATATSGDLAAAEDKMQSDVNKGESVTAAADDASSEFGLGGLGTVAWTTAVTDTCMMQKIMSVASASRIFTIMNLLIRNGTTTQSLASQINTGKITGSEYSSATQLYTGNPNAPVKNPDGTSNEEARMPFSASASWQRITGQQVTTKTPDLDSSSMPVANTATLIFNSISGLLNKIPGERQVCYVSNSPFSFVVSAVGIGTQVFGDGASFGTAEAGTIAFVTGFQLTLQHVIIPQLLQYFMPEQLLGHQDSVNRMNDTDAGLNLAYGNYSRSMGGVPMTNSTATTENAKAYVDNIQSYQRLPLIDRAFSFNDPYSLISKLAVSLPSAGSNFFDSTASFLVNLPSIIPHIFSSSIFYSDILAAQAQTNPGQAYGATQYGYANNAETTYDPISNEQYLFSDVSYGGQSANRISMLGNPNTFTNSPAGDTDFNDLLHCFVDGYTTIGLSSGTNGDTNNFSPGKDATQDAAGDKNCGVIGTYDYSGSNIDSSDMSTDGNTPGEMPNNYTIASIYCNYLNGDSNCINTLLNSGQINNDVDHFRQYLIDLHVMNDYTSLTTGS